MSKQIPGIRRGARRVLRILFLAVIIACVVVVARAQPVDGKIGGLCFRVDDDQPYDRWLEYAQVFTSYGFNFTFALNLDPISTDTRYIALVRILQASGHEFLDHTPNHATHYFFTSDPTRYRDRKGVDHITSSKICLEYESFDTTKRYPEDGTGRIERGTLISDKNGAFKKFALQYSEYMAVYVPALNQSFGVRDLGVVDSSNPDTLALFSFWGEPIQLHDLPALAYKIIGIYDIRMKNEALNLLAERTLELCEQLGLARPFSWIQPGGLVPQLESADIRNTYGANYFYTAAATYSNPALKCYGEYDKSGDRRFAMQWGDFQEDSWDLAKCKSVIADEVAKHYVLIGHSHFADLLGGWSGYLSRMDSLLAWCQRFRDKLPIRTYSEWAQILYSTPQNPYTNIFPPLNVDLDENGMPDGFLSQKGVADGILDTTDGAGSDKSRSLRISRIGFFCYVQNLAGLEKGDNEFVIWTKGGPGNAIEVDFQSSKFPLQAYRFPAVSTSWTRYTLSQSTNGNTTLSIPDSVSAIDVFIRCNYYGGGDVKISGMELRKKTEAPLTIASRPDTATWFGSTYYYKPEVIAKHYGDKLTFTLEQGPLWLRMDSNGMITGVAPPEVGVFTVSYSVRDEHNNVVRQIFALRVYQRKVLHPEKRSIAFGTLQYGTTRDTSVTIQNDGADSVSITNVYVLGSSTVTLSSRTIPPGRQTVVDIRFIAKAIGYIQESIVIESDADNSPDTITVTAQGVTATDTGTVDNVPMEFALNQNFPNPFNPSTTISFSLRYTSAVRLDVVNVLGQKVRTLIGGSKMTSGTHFAVWDGSDDRGIVVSGGIYFARLIATWESGGRPDVATRKMILLR